MCRHLGTFLFYRQFGTVLWSHVIRFFRLLVDLMARVSAHLSAQDCVNVRRNAPFTVE